LSDRDLSRHRTPPRAVTPLSELTQTLTGQFALVGRSGAIVAMSTGLVASASVPAQALAHTRPAAAVSSAGTAASAALTVNSMTTGRSNVLIGSRTLEQRTAISAPSAATVSFEADAFKAAPARVRTTVKTVTLSARATAKSIVPKAKSTAAGSARGASVLSVAARYVGTPYVYGGTTPRGFDCSGFTGYVFRQLGVSLPRTANEQMKATRQISRSEARAGDLVFFVSGGRAYHNGIYAGNNMMYDAPRSGKTLQKREIWSADVVFARATG
jgi:peptidoglycan DL-endopeptidase CwlO